MRIGRVGDGKLMTLLEDDGTVVSLVSGFLQSLTARGCSPNTVMAYAHDLRRFYGFLRMVQLDVEHFRARHSLDFLAHLNGLRRRHAGRAPATPALVTDGLAPSTINRTLAAVSTFYEYLILSEAVATEENPLDPGGTYRRPGIPRRPVRRRLRLRRIQRVPRPLSDDQGTCLMATMTRPRDRAMMLLMLQGGLRCGEVLNLHLEDVQYGRRRVVIRYRTDHPKGVRTKAHIERVVDLYEPDTLAAVNAYMLQERPVDATAPQLFLVCGAGPRAHEPLSYAAVAKLFKRRCRAAGLHESWITPHALRHTHATRLWEGGMRELSLQKRLGHASFESTQYYTRVSDAMMLEDYKRALTPRDGFA
jgi:site-specific recombinase XerD